MTGPSDRTRPPNVLLVEDNDDDIELTRQGFSKAQLAVNLHLARDGEECLEFLRKRGKHAEAPTPDLILLDLNMPKVGGREVLTEIVNDPGLRHLPVVVLTTSSEEQEVLKLYRLRCSSYIVKPVNFQQFLRVIQVLGDYWFSVVTLPPAPKAEEDPPRKV